MLDRETIRVLRLLEKEPAHELIERPLIAPLFALEKGWAAYGPTYDSWIGNRRVKARTICITDRGREALRAAAAR